MTASSTRASGPLSAEELASRVRWLATPRSVVLDDTKKTASLYPKNATLMLRTVGGEDGSAAAAGYSLQWWESVGLQLMSPNKPPNFQLATSAITDIRRGEGKDAAKISLSVADDPEALKGSGGRRLIAFKCMSTGDAETFAAYLRAVVSGVA